MNPVDKFVEVEKTFEMLTKLAKKREWKECLKIIPDLTDDLKLLTEWDKQT